MELERIFEAFPQSRVYFLRKSLPDRPSNPIINDKYFQHEQVGTSSSQEYGQEASSLRLVQSLNYRECSLERQKRIFQEDFEAENEMNQLLSPDFSNLNKDSSFDLLPSSSDSSFEAEFSRILIIDFPDHEEHENENLDDSM